jgi:tetratricopeptide (TPR) repeat protein
MLLRLLILFFCVASFCSAESRWDAYQQALYLHHWEQAKVSWSQAEGLPQLLMRIDYHQARGEPDLAWKLLATVSPRELSESERAYFYLLRARSEFHLGERGLALRNLRALEKMRGVGAWTEMQAATLRAAMPDTGDVRGRQSLIQMLPVHPLRECLAWEIVADGARREKRWLESAMARDQICRWAEKNDESRFLVEQLTAQARALSEVDPVGSLSLLSKSVAILSSLDLDVQPEILGLVSLAGDGDLVRSRPAELIQLRGDLLELSHGGRARWALSGTYHPLPSQLDRTRLLLSALEEAEESGDYLPAAWLALALAERVFIKLDNRWDYIPRARENLHRLGQVYPGRNPFDGVSLGYLDASYAKSGESGRNPRGRTIREAADRYISRSEHFESLDEEAAELISRVEQEYSAGERARLIPRLSSIFGSLSNNLRYWDPDLLQSADLKEPTPAQEILARTLRAKEKLLSKLLREMEMTGLASQSDFYADFLYHLGRFEESKRLFAEVEASAREPGQRHLALSALEMQLRCDVRRGRPLDPATLGRLQTALEQQVLTEHSYRLLSAVELLIVAGRLEEARRHLDRMLESAGSDPESLRMAATHSVFIHRAMVGRLLGEQTDQTLELLNKAREVSYDQRNWGWQVNQAYLAAILAEEGRVEEFLRAYQLFSDRPFPPGTSRLQVQRRFEEAQGSSREESLARQRQAYDKYMERLPSEIASLPIMARIGPEVVESTDVPPATEIFLRSLTPYRPATDTSREQSMSPAGFFHFVGELTADSGGERGYLLPLQRERLREIRSRLAEDAVLYHPILLSNRMVKITLSRREIVVEEFFLNGSRFREDIGRLRDLCADPSTSVRDIESLAAEMRTILWSTRLQTAQEVWLLTPRPLDGVPWPLIAGPESRLRWTDGDSRAVSDSGPKNTLFLAGDHPELPGSRRELEVVRRLFPEAVVWDPETGLEGLREGSREASIIHLTGHGEAVTERGTGEIDLGELQLNLEDLFALNLQQRPLVVLATCQGGAGYETSEGRRFSLVTPFRAVGASGVLANVWALDDRWAAGYFERFYQALKKGRDPESVVYDLRLESVRADEHPYYWSGLFLYQGLP